MPTYGWLLIIAFVVAIWFLFGRMTTQQNPVSFNGNKFLTDIMTLAVSAKSPSSSDDQITTDEYMATVFGKGAE